MRIVFVVLALTLTIGFTSKAQDHIVISGYVTDLESEEKLIGAVVYDSIDNNYAVTNNYGFFSLRLNVGEHHLTTSYVGYQHSEIQMQFREDTVFNISLKASSWIEELLVEGINQNSIISSSIPGRVNMPMKMIERLPSVLGERDVLKSMQHLPGVQPGSEGSTGLYVRGGGYDNNLILLDGVEVFNPDHMFGFFSFFNNDAIKSVKLFKSGFPAQYNDRLASVLDIRTKDGDGNRIKGQATVGLLSSKFQIEGPLIKDKLNFIVSARRTYLDLFYDDVISRFTDYDAACYHFYDINGKMKWTINDRTNFHVSRYIGRDDGSFQTSTVYGEKPPGNGTAYNSSDRERTLDWGSSLLTARLERIITPSLYINVAVGISNYHYMGIESDVEEYAYWEGDNIVTGDNKSSLTTRSDIKMQLYSVDFNHTINEWNHLTYGADFKIYHLNPSIDSAFLAMNDSELGLSSHKISFFAQDEIKVGSKIMLVPGLNLHAYSVSPKIYYKLDKRLLINCHINNRLSVNAAYSDMTQHLHLLRLGSINLASDLWLPTFDSVKPSYGYDFSVGFNYKISDEYSFNVDAYLRSYKDLLYYREGLDFDEQYFDINEIVTSGDGAAKGVELSIEKNSGALTGLMSYSYSISERTVADLNNGETFRSQYDRPHSLKLMLSQRLNKRWSLSGTFVLMSGSLQTLPITSYNSYLSQSQNPDYDEYGGGDTKGIVVYKRNALRLPVYHRLDLSVNYTIEKEKLVHKVHAGMYNAYNAKNIYEVQTQFISDSFDKTAYSLEGKVLFPAIPFVSYSIQLK